MGYDLDKNGKDRRWQCKHCLFRHPEQDEDDHFGCDRCDDDSLFSMFVVGELCGEFEAKKPAPK